MKYIFLHIPKNGGSTLQYIIDSQYKKFQVFDIGEDEREKRVEIFKNRAMFFKYFIKVVKGGHFFFGLHEYFNKPFKVKYFAMFRNPIERTLSYYYYVIRTPEHYLNKTFINENISLEEFLERDDLNKEVHNGQTKLLAGIGQEFYCSQEIFEKAKENLKNHFFLVGLIEYYLETLFLLKEDLNWSNPIKYNILNTNKDKDYLIDKDIERKIMDLNKYDLEIYSTYLKVFKERMNTMNHDRFIEFKNGLL